MKFCYALDQELYFRLSYDGFQAGAAKVSLEDVGDEVLLFSENVYNPYDFFPCAITRKTLLKKDLSGIYNYERICEFDGGSEKNKLTVEDGKIFQIIDFGRFHYFNSTKKTEEKAYPLEEGSPGLFYLLVNQNLSQLQTQGKRIQVRYSVPVADTLSRIGFLERKNDEIIFHGDFAAKASISYGKIISLSFSDEGISFLVSDRNSSGIDQYSTNGRVRKSPVRELSSGYYRTEEISFFSEDGTEIAGVLNIPLGKGPHPAFVLVSGTGPFDRSGGGLMEEIADSMAKNGVIVLRYDKRGVGKSGGNYLHSMVSQSLADLDGAVNYLEGRPETDPLRMGILGHSEGAVLASRIAASNKNIRGVILLASPSVPMFPDLAREQMDYYYSTQKNLFSDEDCINELQKTLDQGKLWQQFNGNRFFLGVLDSYYRAPDPLQVIKQVRTPVLIIHGVDDRTVPAHHAYNLNAALRESGNHKNGLVIIADTGHYFGTTVLPGRNNPYRKHIKVHDELNKRILEWLRYYYI